jgi:pyridoxal phosphate phosphatase PHOSPHO2
MDATRWRLMLFDRQDMALARVGRGLQRRIEEDGEAAGLKCKVVYWEDAWEVEEVFGDV